MTCSTPEGGGGVGLDAFGQRCVIEGGEHVEGAGEAPVAMDFPRGATTDSATTVTAQPEPTALTERARSVSQGVRTSASRRRSQVLVPSPTRSQGVSSENRNAPVRMMTASSSHALVLTVIGCGSGGGAPVGRRLMRARWAGAVAGEPGGPSVPARLDAHAAPTTSDGLATSAGEVRSVLSLTAHPGLGGSAPARAASQLTHPT